MKLLLVEDDNRIASFLRRGLGAEGYEVEVASSGQSALQMVPAGGYSAIILDLLLPDINGRKVCSQLRNRGNQIPVLMLTALDTVQDKVEGFRAGADDYLAKPFSFIELLARLKALMKRANPVTERRVLQHNELTLDHDACQVRLGEQEIELTPKEFTLLAYFMSNHGKVLSKAQILDRAWGMDTDPLTNVVEVYVRRLRQKLEREGVQPLITTVRGFGYRFGSAQA